MSKLERVRKTAGRIRLVNATADHAKLLHDIFTGANTRKYSPVSNPSVSELAGRLRRSGAAFSDKAALYRFFGEIDGVLFGTFVVKNIDWENGEAEIGFSLLEAWQGRGLGTALVYKCLAKLFDESPLERVWATASVTNEASNRLMRSIGFDDCGLYGEAFLINGKRVKQRLYRMHRERAAGLFGAGASMPL